MVYPHFGKKQKPRKLCARELFIERMKREGREHEWTRRYKDYKADNYAWRVSAQKAMDDMGFVSIEIEREIRERFMRFGNAGIPEQIVAAEEQVQQSNLIAVLGEYDINESDLPVDIAFVFHNLHKAVGEQSTWKVTPPEAPTPGAWNMLMWASENQTKFMDRVLGEQLKTGRQGEDQGMKDTGESIEQIEQMLSQLSEVSNGKSTEVVL